MIAGTEISREIEREPLVINSEEQSALRGVLKHQEPMSRHTSWRVGGPADLYYTPADLDDLALFLRMRAEDEPITWIGLGSNLLVRDGGIRGAVVAVAGVLNELTHQGEGKIKAGAGVSCAKVARYAADLGLQGAEFFAGIPGTVGGALAMNAGAFGSETWDIVTVAETINRRGERRELGRAELEIAYRSVKLSADEWFLSAQLHLASDGDSQARERIRELLAKRAQSQPMGESSCGSVFRNPEGDYAARLIEACGLKGMSIGKATVSEKHANFIINKGGSSAEEIEQLIRYVQRVVADKTGTQLKPEVRIIGEGK